MIRGYESCVKGKVAKRSLIDEQQGRVYFSLFICRRHTNGTKRERKRVLVANQNLK